jgi:hypothetical protein
MNKFTQHIPNFCDGFTPERFEFTDLDDLCAKLNKPKSSLVYDAPHVLSINKEETKWYVLGRLKEKVEGLKKWDGPSYVVTEIETVHGWGLDTYEPTIIGDSFEIRSSDIKWYSGFRGGIIGELKDGRSFTGVDK